MDGTLDTSAGLITETVLKIVNKTYNISARYIHIQAQNDSYLLYLQANPTFADYNSDYTYVYKCYERNVMLSNWRYIPINILQWPKNEIRFNHKTNRIVTIRGMRWV